LSVVECAQCKRTQEYPLREGEIAEIMPFTIQETKREQRRLYNDEGNSIGEHIVVVAPKIERWLCGLHSGRDCSKLWHQRWRTWKFGDACEGS
jgi:hypothetical protein